ncbi:MAG: ATP-dependent DNA helicase [Clostridia bacterium]|nr:ATP-dependent DNA helicase [Clostridia bacterium]
MQYDNGRILLRVDELCRLATLHGSLGVPTGLIKPSAAEKITRKIATRSPFFSDMVPLTAQIAFGDIRYEISGVAELTEKNGRSCTVYLTATSKRHLPPNADPDTVKLICLCYLACREYDIENVTGILATPTGKNGDFREDAHNFSSSELQRSFLSYLASVERYARLEINRATAAKSSLREMKFPYGEMRQGQRELIEECYRAIHDGTRLFASAPTGIGKTISTLYPASKALGDGLCDKIFYLTAKTSTRREAFGAVRAMVESGADVRAIVLTAKEQACSNPMAKMSGIGVSGHCNPASCPMARGYYDRAKEALNELLTEYRGYTRKIIEEVAARYNVCPYELSLDLSEQCDIIICDYNYVFDPSVFLKRYFSDFSDKKDLNYVFLVDEAHNLPDRAREMYSAELSFEDFEELYRILPDNSKLSEKTEAVMRCVFRLKRLCADSITKDEEGRESGFYIGTDPPSATLQALQIYSEAIEKWLKISEENPAYNVAYILGGKLRKFLSITDHYDEHFRTYILLDRGRITLKLFCLDPSQVIGIRLNCAVSSILFSATLAPPDYFRDILGGGKGSRLLSLPSPFDRANLCLTAMTGISTRYDDRDTSYSKVASCIAASVVAKKGNYIVYFPSYSYMEQVAAAFKKKFGAVETVIQSRSMTLTEKEQFLGHFKPDEQLRVGFCVLGGGFSEGVDLPGSRLIGSIIVGVGLPGLSNEGNIIRDFYEVEYESGYDYAYTYPGMNRVLQAAGRVIRREDDRGIVVLIDDRYTEPKYRDLFPEHWSEMNFASSPSELAEIIKNFWKSGAKPS